MESISSVGAKDHRQPAKLLSLVNWSYAEPELAHFSIFSLRPTYPKDTSITVVETFKQIHWKAPIIIPLLHILRYTPFLLTRPADYCAETPYPGLGKSLQSYPVYISPVYISIRVISTFFGVWSSSLIM